MGKYDDIINLPHHVSAVHPRMSALDRAAQFSPFAALTGLDAAMEETARVTDAMPQLDEDRKEELDRRLRIIQEHITLRPEIAVTCFFPDVKKAGGACHLITGIVKKLDERTHQMIMENGTSIPIDAICEIECALFDDMEYS